MSKPMWTTDQQKVIDLRDRNILVSAAAGSGKTAVLVERIITMITQGNDGKPPKDIDRLLVVTFTKAAAAEMRARVGAALEQKLQEEPENMHIQKQVSLLHSAQITTIDSFCQSLIKNYFHVIDLDPVFRVADQNDLKLMQAEVLKELLEEKYEKALEQGDTEFLHFTDVFSVGRTDKDIEENVLKLYNASTSWPFPKKWLEECNTLYSSTSVEELNRKAWVQKLCEHIRISMEENLRLARKTKELCELETGPQSYLPAIESDIFYLERMQGKQTYSEYYLNMEGYSCARLKASRDKGVDKKIKEEVMSNRETYLKKGLEKIKEQFFFQSPEEMLRDMQAMSSPVNQLIRLTSDFMDAFQSRKQEEHVVDFSDMEHYALQILLKEEDGEYVPSSVARELQEYYEEIMTDEYQDSNYVQELLLTSLCRAPKEKPYLFMVGDVKQSIYKFRQARPDLFLGKYESYTQEDSPMQRIDLSQNFRSRASVLESANYIFQQIMRTELGGIEYTDNVRLVPGADFGICEERTAGKTELLLLEKKSEEKFLDRKTMEAVLLGEKIRNLVQGDTPMQVKSKDGFRPIRYGDIAILLRSASGWAEEFVQVLTDMGIPAYAETKTGYFTALEVEGVLNYLQVIDNPRQDIPLASALRSCIGTVNDEELAWIGSMPSALNFWDKVQLFLEYRKWLKETKEELRVEQEERYRNRGIDLEKIRKRFTMSEEAQNNLEEKLHIFVARVAKYREMSKYKSVFELLRIIYDETKYYAMMTVMPAGERRKANLDILLQQSVEFEKNGHKGIFGFLQYIHNLKKSEVDFGEASTAGEGMNVVRIMTIHKSKGLEFPVVFVAGMGKRFNSMDAKKATIIDGDYGVGCEFVDLELRVKQPTLIKRFMANEIILGNLSEEIRVLYVALTRAKEQLFISGVVENVEKKLQDWIGRSDRIDFSQLSSAVTYLDWIMPAVLTREKLSLELKGSLARNAEMEGVPNSFICSKEDDLYNLSVNDWKDIFHTEKKQLAKELTDEEALYAWDESVVYDKQMHDRILENSAYRYPYTAESGLPVKISVSELKRRSMEQAKKVEMEFAFATEESVEVNEDLYGRVAESDVNLSTHGSVEESVKEEPEIPLPAFMKENQEVSGATRGTLYHMIMEHFPYEAMAKSEKVWGEKEFHAYLDEMIVRGYLSEEERVLLNTEKFVTFAKSPIGKRMAAAHGQNKLKLEQPFILGIVAKEIYAESDSDEMIMVQGIIDAFFFEEDGIILVDYKTDFVKTGADELVKKYRTQLDYYAQALERLTGKKVIEKVIYSFSLGEEIRMESE